MHRARIASSLAAGMIAEIINKLVPLIILHIVVVRIGIERFGYVNVGIWLIDMAAAFVAFGYPYIGAIDIGRATGDPKTQGQVVSEVICLRIVHGILAVGVLLLLTYYSESYHQYFILVLSLSFVLFCATLDLAFVHVGTTRMASLSGLMVVVKLVSLGFVLAFVEGPEDAILFGVLSFGANAVFSLGSFFLNIRRFPLVFARLSDLAHRFKRTIPYALSAFLFLALDRFDVFLVEHHLGTEGAGLYAGPIRIVQSVMQVVIAIGMVFFSEMIVTKSREALTRHVNLALWAVLALVVPMMTGVWFVAPNLLSFILEPQFAVMESVLAVLVWALGAHALVNIFGLQVLLIVDRPGVVNWILVISLGLGIATGIWWGPSHGGLGFASASLGARVLAATCLFIVAKKYFDPTIITEIWRILLPSLLMGTVLYVAAINSLFWNLTLAACIYGIGILVLNRSKFENFIEIIGLRWK